MKTSIAYTFAVVLSVAGTIPAQERDTTTHAAPATYGWTYRAFTMNEIRMHPARSLEGLMTLTSGITRVNSKLYARGSRSGEVEYRFGGMPALDRWTNTNAIPFIPEMLDRVNVHSGAYGANLGSFGGGVVEMKLREAGDELSADATVLTDDFARPGEQFLNTSSYGWTTAVVSLGTPLPFETKLFLVGEVSRQANRIPTYLEPINITLDRDPVSGTNYSAPPSPFVIGRNHVPSQSAERSVFQWNLVTRGAGPLVEFFGSISSESATDVTWPTAVRNYYRQQRLPTNEKNSTFAAVRLSQELFNGLHLMGAVSYARQRSYTLEPDLGESWRSYADSAANAAKGYPEFRSRYYGPYGYSSIIYFYQEHGSAPSNSYGQESSNTWSTQLRARLDVTESWAVELSGETEWWTLRSFHVGSISNVGSYDYDNDGVINRTFASEYEERRFYQSALNISNFGYDYRGSENEEGVEGPRNPSIVSAAFSTSWREDRFSIDAGLRAQWMALEMPYLPGQRNSVTGGYDWQYLDAVWDYNTSDFRDGALTTSVVESFVLPRLSMQYSLGRGRIYASHGEYVESLPHQSIQLDDHWFSILLDPLRRVPYNIGGRVLTFQVRPSRTSQTEIGAELPIGHGITLSGVAYRKSLKRQVQMGRLPYTSATAPPIVALTNSGESNVTGVEAGVRLEATSAVRIELRYAWTQAQGLGSFPRSNSEYFTDEYYPGGASPPPPILRPLDYNRTHRLLSVFNFTPDAESILHGLSLQTIATIESGTPFTRELDGVNIGGSASVWTIGVRGYQDIRTFDAAEPPNASRTPWVSSLDLSISYEISAGPARLTLFALVTNLFDMKNVLNVYTRTGSPTADGWLESEYGPVYGNAFPQYESFYRMINLQNRWAYMSVTGNDIYGTPRQIRVGAKVGL